MNLSELIVVVQIVWHVRVRRHEMTSEPYVFGALYRCECGWVSPL